MTARCPYIDSCGGCQTQHIPYEQQLQSKRETLEMLYGQDVDIVAQETPYNYRNRMDFVVTKDKFGLKASFKSVTDIPRCEIMHESLNNLLTTIRTWVHDNDLHGCTPGTFDGFLRFVMLRGDEHQQQVTITTTSADNEEIIEQLAKRLNIESLVWTIENEQSEESVGEIHKVYGSQHITLQLANKSFQIDSHSFFQTSPTMAQKAIEEIKKHITTQEVFDLYCGVGVMGQCVAQNVFGVDNNPENIAQARINAELNDIQATYVCEDAATTLRNYQPQTVIVDPPRTGLQSGVHTINAARPETIIYLSCNPKTQARDILALKTNYELTHLQAFDFFAHTEHIECLAILKKK